MAITILTGTNDYTRAEALKKLTRQFIDEHGDLAIERLDGDIVDYDRFHEAVTGIPFLSTKKLVVLKGAAGNKSLNERIGEVLKDVPETTELVIVEAKLDKRGSYYKSLKVHKSFQDYGELDEQSLGKWLSTEAAKRGGVLSASDASYLVSRLGVNQRLLDSELDKLLLYNPKISRESIDVLTDKNPRSTIFDLLEAAFAGNQKKAVELYEEQRKLRVEPQAILALIAWQLHVLALVKSAGDRTPGEIASEGGVNPYVVSKSQNIARRLSLEQLKDLVHEALKLDIRFKSEPIDADSALKNFLISIN